MKKGCGCILKCQITSTMINNTCQCTTITSFHIKLTYLAPLLFVLLPTCSNSLITETNKTFTLVSDHSTEKLVFNKSQNTFAYAFISHPTHVKSSGRYRVEKNKISLKSDDSYREYDLVNIIESQCGQSKVVTINFADGFHQPIFFNQIKVNYIDKSTLTIKPSESGNFNLKVSTNPIKEIRAEGAKQKEDAIVFIGKTIDCNQKIFLYEKDDGEIYFSTTVAINQNRITSPYTGKKMKLCKSKSKPCSTVGKYLEDFIDSALGN